MKCALIILVLVFLEEWIAITDAREWRPRRRGRRRKGGSLLNNSEDMAKPEELNLPGMPKFIQQPAPISYVSRGRPVQIKCVASPVNHVNIRCANNYIPQDQLKVTERVGDKKTGQRWTFYVSITLKEVEAWFDKYECECEAWNNIPSLDKAKYVRSSPAHIRSAYIRRNFPQEPLPTEVRAGTNVELKCLPPEGVPPPTVYWRKDGRKINPALDPSYIQTSEGFLVITKAQLKHTGNYTCLAKNPANERKAEPVKVVVYVDGQWSSWSAWTQCAVECFSGKKCPKYCSTQKRSRHRSCSNPKPVNLGKPCPGNKEEHVPCDTTCQIDGAWSPWSPWSLCGSECQQLRRRECNNPLPQRGGRQCPNSPHIQFQNCTGGMCHGPVPDNRAIAKFITDTSNTEVETSHLRDARDIAMYVGLFVSIAVLLTVVLVIAYLLRRKTMGLTASQRLHYNVVHGVSCARPEKEDKKVHELLIPPDLTQSVVTIKNHNAVDNTHHAKSPSSDLPGALRVQLPSSNTYMSIDKPSGSPNPCPVTGGSSSTNNCSRPSSALYHELSIGRSPVFANFIPASLDPEAVSWGTITAAGGRLVLPESGVSLTIPPGALAPTASEEMFLAVCHEDKDRPRVADQQTVLTPVVLVGPPGLALLKPVIISFPHCAAVKHGGWRMTMLAAPPLADDAVQWEEYITLGHETLNSPGYCQMDVSFVHLMTEQLQRYSLIGESMPGGQGAYKSLRLAAFAPPLSSSLDFNIRVYVLSDTKDAFQNVVSMESSLGGRLLDCTKQLLYRDSCYDNLCFCIEDLSLGWRSRLQGKYQEIPFQHVWNSNQSAVLHCAFSLEHVDPTRQSISCGIVVYQNNHYANRQTLQVMGDKNESPSLLTTSSSMHHQTGGAMTLDAVRAVFRIPQDVRQRVCALLDPPNSRGNDWRMLARQLSVDRYINFFATKTSPTDCILDLWEARHREESALSDLRTALRSMGRPEVAALLKGEPPTPSSPDQPPNGAAWL